MRLILFLFLLFSFFICNSLGCTYNSVVDCFSLNECQWTDNEIWLDCDNSYPKNGSNVQITANNGDFKLNINISLVLGHVDLIGNAGENWFPHLIINNNISITSLQITNAAVVLSEYASIGSVSLNFGTFGTVEGKTSQLISIDELTIVGGLYQSSILSMIIQVSRLTFSNASDLNHQILNSNLTITDSFMGFTNSSTSLNIDCENSFIIIASDAYCNLTYTTLNGSSSTTFINYGSFSGEFILRDTHFINYGAIYTLGDDSVLYYSNYYVYLDNCNITLKRTSVISTGISTSNFVDEFPSIGSVYFNLWDSNFLKLDGGLDFNVNSYLGSTQKDITPFGYSAFEDTIITGNFSESSVYVNYQQTLQNKCKYGIDIKNDDIEIVVNYKLTYNHCGRDLQILLSCVAAVIGVVGGIVIAIVIRRRLRHRNYIEIQIQS